MISVTPAPCARSSTIRARQTSFCGVFRPATQLSSRARSSGDSQMHDSLSIPHDSHDREPPGNPSVSYGTLEQAHVQREGFGGDELDLRRGRVASRRRVISLFSAEQGTLIPCSPEKFPVRSGREFCWNRLESLGFSDRFFRNWPEMSRFPCIFPCCREF